MDKLAAELRRLKLPVVALLIGIVVFFSLKNTLDFYFYTDDYAVLYHYINNIPYIYPFYVFVPRIYGPIYNLFGLNPLPYFSLALISHVLASLSVYLLAKKITKNNLIGLFSSLIFATGYIGIDSFSQMNTASVDNLNVLFTMLLVLLFYSFLKTKKLPFYFLSLVIFYLSVTIFPFRAFPMILFLLTTDVILSISIRKFISSVIKIFLRDAPFVAIYYLSGLASYGGGILSNFIKDFSANHIDLFFSILGNFFIPSTLKLNINSSLAGIILFIGIGAIIFFGFKKHKNLTKSVLLLALFVIEGFIGFFILLPVFSTNNGELNRYLSLSFAAYSILIPLSSFLFFKIFTKTRRSIWIVPSLLAIAIFSILSFNYQSNLVKERSTYAKQFFIKLKSYLSVINKNETNIFYFDTANYFPVPQHFGSILLGAYMPSESTLAVQYKIPIEKIHIARSFNEVYDAFKSQKGVIHTFYYDDKGLHDTTSEIKGLLSAGKIFQIPLLGIKSTANYSSENTFITYSELQNLDNGSFFKSPKILISTGFVPSIVQSVLKFDLRIRPKNIQNFPLYDFSSVDQSDISRGANSDFTGIDRSLYFDYLTARKNYYKEVSVEVSSSHPTQPKGFLIDNNPNTYWFTQEGPWQIGRIPWVKIDLGEIKRVNRIVWANVSTLRTPRNYEIFVSIDGKNWKSVKSVTDGKQKQNGEVVSDYFPPQDAKFIMVKIYKTTDRWAPGFSEIEVVEDKFDKVDVSLAAKLQQEPFQGLENLNDLNLALSYIQGNSEVKIFPKTNADKEFNQENGIVLPFTPDGKFHSYSLELPAGGLYFKDLMIGPVFFPAEIEFRNLRIEAGNYSE